MIIGIIGDGAIGSYVRDSLLERGHVIRAILKRRESLQGRATEGNGILYVTSVGDLPDDIEHMIDCAGHLALKSYGPDILRHGTDLTTVSIGALADPDLHQDLQQAATAGHAKLHLASGAIGALDCLRAARVGSLQSVTYIGRKPPRGWRGSAAETRLDLDNLDAGAEVHLTARLGTRRWSIQRMPMSPLLLLSPGWASIRPRSN